MIRTRQIGGLALVVGALASVAWALPQHGGQPAGGAPMVEITKNCPHLRYVGREATFEIMVTNRGTGPASNVVVTDALPAGAQFLSADSGGQRQGSNVMWSIGSLGAGESKTMKVNVRCDTITTLRNVATVTWCGMGQAVCELPVKGIPAILLECVDDPDPVEIGTQTTYTIMVTNQGSETGTNIRVECTLPREEEFVRAGGATQGSAEGKMVKFAPLATLAPKARASFTVTVKGVAAGDCRFAVSMKSDQIETPVGETESTNVYE
ncbi:MAG: DUF11 domain-containing protein [Phycisphaerae bacterium]